MWKGPLMSEQYEAMMGKLAWNSEILFWKNCFISVAGLLVAEMQHWESPKMYTNLIR